MATLGVAADITAYLADAGLGTLAVGLFTDDMPADPDDVIVISEYTGPPPLWVRGNHEPTLEYPRIQLSVRGGSYTDVLSRAEAAHAALLSITDIAIEGIHYGHVRNVNSGWLKTRDERGRHLWQRNYEVSREAVTTSI